MGRVFDIRLTEDAGLSNWNHRMMHQEYSTLQQTVNWGIFLSRYYRATTYHVVVNEGYENIAGSLLMHRIGCYPEIYNKKPVINLVKSIVNRFNQCLSWSDGPVFYSDSAHNELLDNILRFVEDFAVKNNIKSIRRVTLPVMAADRRELEGVFEQRGYKKALWATYITDLRKPIEDIWACFNGKTVRTPVRRAQSMGLAFKESSKDGIAAYFSCDFEHSRLKNIPGQPKKRIEALYDALSPIDGYKIFCAVYGNLPVAFMPLRCFNKTVHIVKPVKSKVVFDNKIPAGDFLVWECMKWAKEHGFWYFDFSGISPNPVGIEKGIRFFKEKWGGDYYEYGIFSKQL